jgi:hypothetical protein
VKTASVHVSNILGKLGVASRGEAAAAATGSASSIRFPRSRLFPRRYRRRPRRMASVRCTNSPAVSTGVPPRRRRGQVSVIADDKH